MGVGLWARVLAAALFVAALSAPAAEAARSRPPVVFIVFDEFPADSIVAPGGRIDAERFPGFAALAKVSTWYPNATAVGDETFHSVPSILTGTNPTKLITRSWADHPRNPFTSLGRRGYRIHYTDDVVDMCSPKACPDLPPFHQKKLSPVSDRVDQDAAAIRSLRHGGRPQFVYLHSLLPHVPWHMSPSGHLRDSGPDGGLARELAGPVGFSDPFVTQQNEQRHLLQVGYVDREVSRLLRRLKRTRLLRRALIIVTADHGISFQLGVSDRRSLTPRNVEDIAPVPLLIKRPGQRHGRVSRAYVRGTDIAPTLMDILGLRPNWHVDGRSAYSRAVRSRRAVSISHVETGLRVRISAAQLERRRRANVARHDAVTGHGSWRRVYGIGPHPELLGKRPEDFASAPAATRASFDLPRGLTAVDPSKRVVPTWAFGRLRGDGGTGDRRDLALVVNGRIRAVGRSIRLSGKGELFSLLFDERYLRRGRNTVGLWQVVPRGGGFAFAYLGGELD